MPEDGIAVAKRVRQPTQRDVAKHAAVSVATVSYVLSGRRDRARPVTGETRERVLQAVRELGYQGNYAARSLRRRRSELVCVVYRPPSGPWIETLIGQLHTSASQRGYAIITLPIAPGDPTEAALRVLRERYVDGAILTPDYGVPAAEMRSLAGGGLALVAFDDDVVPREFDAVRSWRAEACYAVADHLIRRGHHRIAYLAEGNELDQYEPGQPITAVKYASYRQALARHGLPFDESLVAAAADARDQAYAETTKLLQRPDRPTAIFSASDRGAINAIWAARDLGFSVPGDVAVAGIGNTAEGASVRPALTTAGIRSLDFTPTIDRLWARIDGKAKTGTQLEQRWELIIRSST
jgi:LacI family transcriptional regulator